MPRPRQAQGRPNTAVIPDGWSESHAVVVAGTLTTTCSIRHPGSTPAGVLDPATGRRTGAAPRPPHHDGPCEVSPMSEAGRLAVIADEQVTTATYEVKLPRNAAPSTQVDDIVTVSGLGDLVVLSVSDPTQSFSRVLVCTRHQP